MRTEQILKGYLHMSWCGGMALGNFQDRRAGQTVSGPVRRGARCGFGSGLGTR